MYTVVYSIYHYCIFIHVILHVRIEIEAINCECVNNINVERRKQNTHYIALLLYKSLLAFDLLNAETYAFNIL